VLVRLLALAAVAGVLLAASIAATREPSEPAALAAFLLGLGVTTFGVASALFYYAATLRSPRRRPRAMVALRRGGILAVGVIAIGALRALDALSAVTAGFLVAFLAALEGGLSARG
jgi:hypothetical protein